MSLVASFHRIPHIPLCARSGSARGEMPRYESECIGTAFSIYYQLLSPVAILASEIPPPFFSENTFYVYEFAYIEQFSKERFGS